MGFSPDGTAIYYYSLKIYFLYKFFFATFVFFVVKLFSVPDLMH